MTKEQKYSLEFETWYSKKAPIWCDEYCAKCGKRYMWGAWNAGQGEMRRDIDDDRQREVAR